ncbi:MAG: phosphomethylpyrimidine synthase [Sphingomonas bacterium]|nr:phosphomethylpyrimidine synthase [Sphingomonas bacterium]
MEIMQEVRDFAAMENAPVQTFVSVEDAEAGMAEMSERLRERGGDVYLPAAE